MRSIKSIVLGGGCFWCVEAIFQRVKGIEKAVSGFAGGGTEIETDYAKIHTSDYGHAEVVEITYDPETISLETLLDIFFYTHDPTTLNQPGTADTGKEYRSIILCDKDELELAIKTREKAQKLWDKPIITEIAEIDRFYPAEKEHQNFYNNNPNGAIAR